MPVAAGPSAGGVGLSADDESGALLPPNDVADEPQRLPTKPTRITVHRIVERNLAAGASEWSQETIAKALGDLTHVRLDRENIGEIDGLEVLGTGSLRCLYLQHNCIRTIENLEWLTNLRFLALQYNSIRRVENVTCLPALGFLDLSFNAIAEYDLDEFPKSLVILNLQGNPCTAMAYHRAEILAAALPKLRQLDDRELSQHRVAHDDSDELEDDEDNEIDSPNGTISLTEESGQDEEEEDEATGGRIVSTPSGQEQRSSPSAGDSDKQARATPGNRGATMSKLTDEKGLFSSLGSAIVARSHSRVAELEREHDIRLRELEAIRSRLGICLDSDRPESGRSEQRRQDRQEELEEEEEAEASATRGGRRAAVN